MLHADSFAPLPATEPGDSPALRNALEPLGDAFYSNVQPQAVPDPHWIAASLETARDLAIPGAWLQSDEALQLLSGNADPAQAQTRASVYSGHQFGVWAGQLGDGRALLLGELDTPQGPFELQLKGSGPTPYSRRGDGRAVLRSSIREFLASEALHALGIPTTRALALIGSPLRVRRETLETAAVVTRAAPSFLRFGHFEHFAAAGRIDELRRLADHVIDRHYSYCRTATALANPYARLLQAVSERTAALVAQWQAVGFCHGVLNTDNMSVLGLTIDYGPFQFLDDYVPGHICNHSDHMGRYAFDQQPNVAYWNLFCLGQALQPLIGVPERALEALESFKEVFPEQLTMRYSAKLGIANPVQEDALLIEHILALLAKSAVDYTLFWRNLSVAVANDANDAYEPVRDMFKEPAELDAWLLLYKERTTSIGKALAADLMLRTNPEYVLRNYLAQQAIQAAQQGDFSETHRLQIALSRPFESQSGCENYAAAPPAWASDLSISCSS